MQATATTLLVKPAAKLDMPMETIFRTRAFFSIMVSRFSRRMLLSLNRNLSTHAADKNWEMIVARAAPRTSMRKPKMNTGSRMMLATAPRSTVCIPIRPKPWELIKAFIPSPIITNTLPSR